jgi:hypothetical protein
MHQHEMQQSNIYLGIYIIDYYLFWKIRVLQIVSPIIKDVKLNRVLIDGKSSLNILFLKTINHMRLSRSALCSSKAPFHGIVPRAAATPVSQITLLVTFGT